MSLLSASLAGVIGQFVLVSAIYLVSDVLVVLSGVLGWFVLPSQAHKEV